MTGEMHKTEVTREAFPVHFAIADALYGEVRPFDVYQGPYVLSPRGKFWLISDDGCIARVYNERNDKKSGEFLIWDDFAADVAVQAAFSITS